ncbi:glycosyltransferase family 2 protein [Roseiconus nitratireducens]|uniref:Glycosyltransferase family 2 protein n=1 Tax=Roseiconus nitratireducens TaxID=2605748 RepID=A0A5M6DBP3_9BACT|nr:glycosyltransferase family A protein [Roseiconus nitratireducens]KAA5543820.1 glycosyltransferase family 2 protein [Roseiconus nitratireducens]
MNNIVHRGESMSLEPGLVSTIIPVFNRPEMLRGAVQSVLQQTYRPIEIIIVDDGSTDETPSVAEDLQRRHEGVVRFTRQSNSGPGPAREAGRQLARGEFLQYLDSDDRLTRNKFTDQVASLRKAPDCDIAYGITRLVNERGDILADPFKWTGRSINNLFPGLLVDRWWCTHTPLYRRRVTDRIGPWCKMRWSQDWEYDSRIGALNVNLVSCGTHVSDHVHHDGVRQTSSAAWTTDPIRLANRVELLQKLWNAAIQAGVNESAPERQHFARWSFMIGRQCAAQGMVSDADQCFQLADASAGQFGQGRKGIATYRLLLRTLGPTATARVEKMAGAIRKRPGSATMQQSFESTP